MENLTKDFRKFAISNTNVNTSVLDDQIKKANNVITNKKELLKEIKKYE